MPAGITQLWVLQVRRIILALEALLAVAALALTTFGGSEVLQTSQPAGLQVHTCLAAHGLVVWKTRTVLRQ
eukprot:765811-Heterocapsa_arctica.AAC.1